MIRNPVHPFGTHAHFHPSVNRFGIDGSVRAVAFSPDGSLAITGSEDGTALLWNTQSRVSVGKSYATHSEAQLYAKCSRLLSAATERSPPEAPMEWHDCGRPHPATPSAAVTTQGACGQRCLSSGWPRVLDRMLRRDCPIVATRFAANAWVAPIQVSKRPDLRRSLQPRRHQDTHW